MFDTLSNLFSHIQNGQKNGLLIIKYRHSHRIIAILNVLVEHGYIRGFRFCSNQGKKGTFQRKQIEILLKYQNKNAAISKLVRISKPSRRIYLSADQLVRIRVSNEPLSQLIQGTSGNRRKKQKTFSSRNFARREDTFLFMQGIFILSTSKGIMSNITAQKLNVGGEVLGHVCS